jgi:ankyrin repeat protein
MKASAGAALCVALPGSIVIAGAAAWLVMVVLRVPPAIAGVDVTLAEAAMLADHADVVRLVRAGADPNAPARVRAGTLDFSEHVMTPLEAAARSRQSGIVQLLLDSGARMTATSYPRLWCSANRVPNNGAVISFLDLHRPGEVSSIDCASVPIP